MATVTGLETLVRPLVVEVRSESDPRRSYTVTLAHCDCEDFYWRRGSADAPFCKHILAAYAQAGWHGISEREA